jgi:hypothetical protein
MGRRWASRKAWGGWLALVLLASFGTAFLSEQRGIFLPGTTSDGHHLIEASCNSCHAPFEGVSNERCSACHMVELASDVHPPALFNDPRWAAELEKLNVSLCVACHSEHHAAAGSVRVRRDFCFNCHREVEQRASHRGFAPTTCGDAGCHNYHDGSVLREDYLRAHQGEPALLDHPEVLARVPPVSAPPQAAAPPEGLEAPVELVTSWRRSAHARLKVGCASCHESSGMLVLRPGRESCQGCHAFEVETFLAGKHGMRTGEGLPPLRPRDARLPMKPRVVASELQLDCATCHDPHSVDTRPAATQACLVCHDDRHTQSYAGSPHARTALALDAGSRPGEQMVTCATCHMPRVVVEGRGGPRVAVNHNNSLTLAPPDRMAAMVCTDCHGLEFSLATLLDRRLVDSNFKGRPQGRLKSFKMLTSTENQKGSV